MTTLDPTLLAAAIGTVIAALLGATLQTINAVSAALARRDAALERRALLAKTEAVQAVAVATAAKADTLIESTAKIHDLADGTNSHLQRALELMTERVAGLEKVVALQQETARETKAAQAQANVQTAAALAAPPPPSPPALWNRRASDRAADRPPSPPTDPAIARSLADIDANTKATAQNTTQLVAVARPEDPT